MICNICGAEYPETENFCPGCGTATPIAPPPTETAEPESFNSAEPIFTADPVFSAELPPKKSSIPLFAKIIAIVLCLAMTIGIAGFFTDWFGYYGPAAKISKAAIKTLGAKNYTIDIDLVREYEFYDSYNDSWNTSKYTYTGYLQVQMDIDKRELTVYGELENENGGLEIVAIYDGYSISYTEYSNGDVWYSCEDISDQLDEIFDAYEENKKSIKKLDWEELLSSDAVEDAYGEDLYDEASEYINFKNLTKCLKKFSKKLNSTSWMKKNAGMTTSRENGMKVYTFNPDIAAFASASLPIFESAFEDSDDYEELEDSIEDLEDATEDANIEFKFGTKGGKLTMVSFDVTSESAEFYSNTSCSFNFTNINKTKIDMDDLDDLLDEAQDYEERN